MRALVDADGLIYLAGFGVEKTQYQCVLEDKAGNLDVVWFPTIREIKAFLSENPDVVELDRINHKHVEPVEHALSIVKKKLSEIQDRYGQMEVYIRALVQRNFRMNIATIHPYKGTRNQVKPQHHDAIRSYLVERWGAIQIHDQEVDDEVGCRITELESQGIPYVVCSPDKDLDQLPGLHFNYRDNTQYEVDPEEARRWFWYQALAGDYSDNIRGCWGMGETKAAKLVDSWMEMRYTDSGLWKGLVRTYEESMGLEGCPYAGMPPELVALENAQLVYMRRQRNEIWQPPGQANTFEKVGPSLDG